MYKKLISAFCAASTMCVAQVADFESLTLLGSNSNWNSTLTSDFFSSQDIKFKLENLFGYWDNGFSYSNVQNTTLAGYDNQYSAITGKGFLNSEKYAICYNQNSKILFPTPTSVLGFYISNTTYAYISMRDGDNFAKKFIGSNNTFPGDYFKVTAKSYLNGVLKTTSGVDFYLADFRDSDVNNHFILDSWQWMSLTALGLSDSLIFSFESSDVGAFGINTPKYFAMDNFTVQSAANALTYSTLDNNSFQIFPNPSTDGIVNISNLGNAIGKTMYVFNAQGAIVNSQNINSENLLLHANLTKGLYFIKIDSITKKIVFE